MACKEYLVIQETHFKKGREPKYWHPQLTRCYYSLATNKMRGDGKSDCSFHRKDGGTGRANRALIQFLRDQYIFDIWRCLNPKQKDFTFYSSPHKSHNRIDLLLISGTSLPYLLNSNIEPKTWSDHSPITVTMLVPQISASRGEWRLNESLLADNTLCKHLYKQIDYFKENNQAKPNQAIIWDTHKVVIRGHLIKQGAHLKKKKLRTQQITKLTDKLRDLEFRHKHSIQIH
ncbi:hypothetical protein XELAEV_18003266mg [Xenopus laevis]|nr:hypothetical protein XELAEV_18003266mg [Xenopus laevis]